MGMGDISLLTEKAHTALREADLVMGTERLCKPLPEKDLNIEVISFQQYGPRVLEEARAKRHAKIALLVSGDVCFYSATSSLMNELKKLNDVHVHFVNGINCVQYFLGQLRMRYDDIVTVSAHGRATPIVPYVCYNKKVFVLSGGARKAHDILRELVASGLGGVRVHVGENLSQPQERLSCGRASELVSRKWGELCVLLILNEDATPCFIPLRDEDYSRENVPMTKRNVRSVSVENLAIQPDNIVYDVGAGTGSVSIQMARRAHQGMVYAIERHEKACQLIEKNRRQLGAYNVAVVHGMAPGVLSALPKPDCVFIGGSAGNLSEIVDCVVRKNHEVRLCLNAITLETLAEGKRIFERLQREYEITCVQSSHSEKVGAYHMMRGENPVYILSTK